MFIDDLFGPAKKLTAQQKKIKYNYDNRIKSIPFKTEISNLREEYKIPRLGFSKDENVTLLDWPPQWKYVNDPKMRRMLSNDLDKLISEFHFLGMRTLQLLPLVFYNLKSEYNPIFSGEELCMLSDIHADKRRDEDNKAIGVREIREKDKSLDIKYPINLRISPYASQRDITSFLHNHRSEIKEMQKIYKTEGVLIGKLRKKDLDTAKLYDFAYENRERPYKAILALIQNSFKKKQWKNLDEQGIAAMIQSVRKSML